MFATYCFLIRGLEALGAAAYTTATYVFVVEVFPTNVGAVLGFMETFVGLGMSMGPAIGGLLYSVSNEKKLNTLIRCVLTLDLVCDLQLRYCHWAYHSIHPHCFYHYPGFIYGRLFI